MTLALIAINVALSVMNGVLGGPGVWASGFCAAVAFAILVSVVMADTSSSAIEQNR